MSLSYEEKLEILGLTELRADLSETAVNKLYVKHLEDTKPQCVLKLLNSMLDELGCPEVKSLEKFTILISDVKNMDGKAFVEKNWDIIKDELFLDPYEDLKFKLADKRVKYPYYILEGLAGCIGYEVVGHRTQAKTSGGEYKDVRQYKLMKSK